MDVCDGTFSNTTTFKSLPQAFHKTQACMCLNCSLKLSSAARGEDILPTHPSYLQGRNPQQWDLVLWCFTARDWKLLLMHHWLPLFHPRVLPRSQSPSTMFWGPPYPAVTGLFPFALQPALDGLTCSSGSRKASCKQALI